MLEQHNSDLKHIVPIAVTGGQIDFTLLAIWANNVSDHDGQYVEQVWKAVNHYDLLLNGPIILTGDFNSNTFWDKVRRVGNHSHAVTSLAANNIFSVCDKRLKQEQGKE